MEKENIIYRQPHSGEKEYLRVIKHKHKTLIKGKKFQAHGSLVNTDMAGNGYHGNCCNCGLPLTTDLGYSSWDGVPCEIKEHLIVDISQKFKWFKCKHRATKLTSEEARNLHGDLIRAQGWGKYNYQIINVRRD